MTCIGWGETEGDDVRMATKGLEEDVEEEEEGIV